MKNTVKLWEDAGAVTAHTLQKVIDINTGFSTALLCQHVEMLNIFAESSIKQLQLLSKARTTHDFLLGQSRNLKDFSRKTTNNTLITAEIMSSTKVQLESLLNNIWKDVLAPYPIAPGTAMALVK